MKLKSILILSLVLSSSAVFAEKKKSVYLDEAVPFEQRLKLLEKDCLPLIEKRGPSLNNLFQQKLKQAKQQDLTADQQKTALMPLLGMCMGVGVKL